MRNFPHESGIDVRKRAFGPQTPKTTLWVNLSEFGFFFYHDRLWCSGDLEVELQCHVTETNFLCAGSRLGVRHQPSIWSSKRLTSQAPQVPPGFQASSTLRSWLCTSTDAQSAGPVLVSSLRKVVIGCGPWSRSTTLAMSSWLSGVERNFAEKLDLCYFSFHAADFPSSAILNSFQELCHRTRTHSEQLVRTERLPLQLIRCTCRSIYALLPADPVSAGPAPGAALRMLHACWTRAFAIVRGKSSDAVWPGLEAYRRWSPFLQLFALLSALDM